MCNEERTEELEHVNEQVNEAFDPFDGDADPTAMPDAGELQARRRELAEQRADALKQAPDADARTSDLLARMHDDRRGLLAVLRACVEPQPQEGVAQALERAAAGRRSVFGPDTICRLLEQAGALERIEVQPAVGEAGEGARDGAIPAAGGEAPASPTAQDVPEAAPQDPQEGGRAKTVVIDGVEYLEPRQAPFVSWKTTAAGARALAADRPLERVEALFEEKADYLPVFKRVLAMCGRAGGAATRAINAAVDDDPAVQKPRYYAAYFTERLEECDAIAWQAGAWHTTDTGTAALDMLAGVDDEYGRTLEDGKGVA